MDPADPDFTYCGHCQCSSACENSDMPSVVKVRRNEVEGEHLCLKERRTTVDSQSAQKTGRSSVSSPVRPGCCQPM